MSKQKRIFLVSSAEISAMKTSTTFGFGCVKE
jgi:hypothetical protein